MSRIAAPWWLAALAVAVVGFAASLVQPSRAIGRDIRLEAMRSLVAPERTYMGDPAPSIEAARRLMHDPRARLYDADLSVGSEFIYPPIAALPYRPLATLTRPEAHDRLALVNHVLFVAVVLLLLQLSTSRRRVGALDVAACAMAAVVFYPLVHAVELNQATVAVTLLIGLTWVALDERRPALAGAVFALALAVKPQLVLALPAMAWHARRMVASSLATASALACASIAYAGWDNQVAYVTHVLPALSRGYTYYANQGLNGLYGRMFVPGGDLGIFEQPPDSPVVRAATLVSAAVVLAGVLLIVRHWHARPRPVAPTWVFAVAWLATVLVSPVSWQHHYAPALFAFVLVARALREQPSLRTATVAALASAAFTLMAAYFEVRRFQGVAERLLASYVLYGALALGATLVLLIESGAGGCAEAGAAAGAVKSTRR